ncbi:CFI-box-CTERM domain-containing protein [Flavobacterium ammonificans]|uniref:Uncharacterized protein n=1 Tax=Flavobacterium ammonificans TaxID=1751056 RepID=A0ABN6KVA7_9FLAO|nr:CFI-box-CTERM domain-containing protein [Flavobacterium ammonificans]BDB53061.1 hypothetical protein GENT11_13730 [Flavobacterium ammonificans]
MNLVLNNPYRIVGLLVGASAREQDRQIKRLKQFIAADIAPEEDFSFPSLGNVQRNIEKVDVAASKLNLDKDKIVAALFWFYKGNPITDEPAFDAINDSDLNQVLVIWKKLTLNGEISKRNASAFSNLGTLYLSGVLEGTNSNEALLENGISLKLKFLESEYIKEFKSLATDETYKTTKKELQLIFLNQLQSEIEKSEFISSTNFLDIITQQEFSAKEDFLKGFVQKPIEEIEKNIEEARIKRKADNSNSLVVGKELFKKTSENLKLLKSILGISNLKFSSISDKLSDEILQCGIDYFKFYKDSSTDPGRASMDLFHKAKLLAIGDIAIQRCEENTENLQEWIDNKPERDKQAKIFDDFKSITDLIDEYEGYKETVLNGKQLLASALIYLSNVKDVLGERDDLFIGLSTRIASEAQGMCVSEINNLQDKFSSAFDSSTKVALIRLLKDKINESLDVSATIGSMHLKQDFRIRYERNRSTLIDLKRQLNQVNTGGGSSGCYIATMAYGDYDHPQVMILRQFRDDVLNKSAYGKWFIKTYYHYSPKLVERLKNQRTINIIIRKTLNQFIKLIK